MTPFWWYWAIIISWKHADLLHGMKHQVGGAMASPSHSSVTLKEQVTVADIRQMQSFVHPNVISTYLLSFLFWIYEGSIVLSEVAQFICQLLLFASHRLLVEPRAFVVLWTLLAISLGVS